MRRHGPVITLVGAAALATAVASATRSQDQGEGQDALALVTEGTEMVPPCASCHGEDGLGNADMAAPMLAGMDAGYLARALASYADGTRLGYTMNSIASELTPEQIEALARHYAALPAAARQWEIDEAAARAGEALVREGLWSMDVPACTSCHGENAEGVGSVFPRLAGQLPVYMSDRIAFWRSGEDAADNPDEALMASIAKRMPEEEMAAAIAYLAGLAPEAGPSMDYPPVELAWEPPVLRTEPLPNEILWGAAESAYEAQQARVSRPDAVEHTPPSLEEIPDGPEGDMIRLGRFLFSDTQTLRGTFVGNDQNCSNCHMNAGAEEKSAPVWATAVDFPQFRGKNQRVNTLPERIAGCFTYSMDGTPPPAQHKVMVAIETYMEWLGKGIPSGAVQKVRGYGLIPVPEQKPDYARGETVYVERCAVCHGEDGQGVKTGDRVVFPPLWGPEAFNWGAGMHTLDNAAGFVKHNMPLGNPDLTDQQVWDVVLYMNSHERPQDPRWKGDVRATRNAYHDHTCLYGLGTANGLMGDTGEPLPKPEPQPWSNWRASGTPLPAPE